eukprot:2725978-Amphidinium_carterae.4
MVCVCVFATLLTRKGTSEHALERFSDWLHGLGHKSILQSDCEPAMLKLKAELRTRVPESGVGKN